MVSQNPTDFKQINWVLYQWTFVIFQNESRVKWPKLTSYQTFMQYIASDSDLAPKTYPPPPPPPVPKVEVDQSRN